MLNNAQTGHRLDDGRLTPHPHSPIALEKLILEFQEIQADNIPNILFVFAIRQTLAYGLTTHPKHRDSALCGHLHCPHTMG